MYQVRCQLRGPLPIDDLVLRDLPDDLLANRDGEAASDVIASLLCEIAELCNVQPSEFQFIVSVNEAVGAVPH